MAPKRSSLDESEEWDWNVGGVAGVEVQGCESLELELDKLLWGHFEMRDLGGGAKKKKMGSGEDWRASERERKEGRVRSGCRG